MPEVTRAIAGVYTALVLASECMSRVDSLEAFEELTDGDGALGEAARDAPELARDIAGLEGHERLWPTAALGRWWIARHAGMDEAGELLEQAVEVAEDPALVLQAALVVDGREGAWDSGEAIAERLLEETDSERSRYLVARFEAWRGNHERALELFFEAYEDDELVEGKVGFAVHLLKLGRERERPLRLLEEALDEDDELLAARFALGVVFALEGDDEVALEHLEVALELAQAYAVRGYEERIEATLEELAHEDD